MSLQARRIGETQAQYRRRVGTKRPQTVGRPQKVERVSVMPQDMKAKDIPNQKRARVERRPQRPQQVAEAKAFPEERGRPVTRIGNRTIYEADMREAKANQQNLLEAQRRNAVSIPVTKAEDMPIPAGKRVSREDIIRLQREAFRKMRQQQLRQQRQKQQQVNPRTGKPFTPQQLKQIRANNERFAKEQATKQPLLKKFMEGSIGVRELRGTFTPREIRNIEKGRIAQQFMQGKITDRQLSSSGKFSLKEIRDIKRNAEINRMSPEERRAFIEREQQRQLRRQRRPDRRRRQVRRAYRRGRGDDRDNVITYQTTGRRRRVSPTQTQRRRVAPTQRRRRGMRVPI